MLPVLCIVLFAVFAGIVVFVAFNSEKAVRIENILLEKVADSLDAYRERIAEERAMLEAFEQPTPPQLTIVHGAARAADRAA